MASEELLFVPLGGAGQIGMNMGLYGLGKPGVQRWIIVDMGIAFANGTIPGVDVLTPDPAFIVENRERLEGLVITHAHEDHLGAVPYLWNRLECPIYATPFAASILRRKLRDVGLEEKAPISEITPGGRFDLGPFDLQFISVAHSIPEANSLIIRTPLGTVLHTGDWKFDPAPVVGPVSDENALKSLGDEGVMAIVCDSTNVFNQGTSGSEDDLLASLGAVIATCKKRVAVACFATNVARLKTISSAARANGRDVVLVGRSLVRINEVARENGYLANTPPFISDIDAGHIPDDKLLIICTGSQGEPRAALSRIAGGSHPNVTLGAGDTVIFSSKVIPGNGAAIARLQDQLVRNGVKVIGERDEFVHVSGHPCRDEMIEMYNHIRPRISVPVHGEYRHLVEHAKLAADCNVAETVVVENGSMLRLAPDAAAIVDEVAVGRLAVEGNRLVAVNGDLLRSRSKSVYNGSLVVTVVVNGSCQMVGKAQITAIGLVDEEDGDVNSMVNKAVSKALNAVPERSFYDDDKVAYEIRITVRRAFRERFAKKPLTAIHLVRV